MAPSRDQFEAELRVALAEGILSTEEADTLRAEALHLERSPLELLRAKGRLSEGSLISLVAQAREAAAPGVGQADETATVGGNSARPGSAPEEPGVGQADETATVGPLVARAEPPPQTPTFPVRNWDRYQPVKFLGQGGMGRVFLAYDPRLRRNVALKFVRNEDTEHTRRFISEARSQARVNHERVCKVYEVGEVQGRIFIAMQYIDGQPLNALAHELSVEQKAMVLRESALAVHEAHRVGLIHRDIKPSNIMVERAEDGALKPYVMDFGLARDWNEQGTADGTVLGTPHYMAPEQARGEVATMDRRADVYSLGATLYHLLTGQPPIPGSNGLEVVSKIATHEPRPPRTLNPDLPADLEAITLKCLEKDRSARYDSARALAEELERFLSGEPVQARASGLGYRLRKKLRKHRAMVSVASAALVLVLLALGWADLQRREVLQRERLARRFTELVERVEAQARYSDLSPLHDTRADRQALRARMDELNAEIREAGAQAVGPGHYALGRGYLALGDEAKAREHLDSAWASDFREPRVAYALALVMGQQYQQQLLEAERIRNPEQRKAQQREIERRYRDPALEYLKRSQGAEVPSPEYVAALFAFYEGRLDDALARLDALGNKMPWFYEAPKLRGDILLARATRRWNAGEREGALADFESGRKAYATAIAIGESVPALHQAQGELEYSAMVMALYGQGEVIPHYTQGIEAVSRARAVAPDHYDSRVLEARFHRRLTEYRKNLGEDVRELPAQAVAAARSALELAPSRPQARMELGRSHWIWGDFLQSRSQDPSEQLRKAVESFESIPPEDRNYEFHANLGLVFKVWADYEEQVGADPLSNQGRSIESYLKAIQLNAQLPDAWINLGITYLTRASHARSKEPDEDLARAREALEKARELNPKHLYPYFYAGRVHELLARRKRIRGGDAAPDLERSVEMYRKGLEINSRIPHLHNGLGLALLEQARESWDHGGDPTRWLDQARAAFEQAVAVAPTDGLGYLNLGEVLAQQALYQRARGEDPGPSVRAAGEALRKALQRNPAEAVAWSNLGMVHSILATFELEHGRDPRPSLSRADEALRKALTLNPRHAQSWHYQGETLGARALFQVTRAQDPGEGYAAAVRAFQKALELAPEQQEFRIGFGHFLRRWATRQQQVRQPPGPALEQGLALAHQVLALRPHWPDARLLRGSLLMLQAQAPLTGPQERREGLRLALEDLTQALSANPNFSREWRDRQQRLQQLVLEAR